MVAGRLRVGLTPSHHPAHAGGLATEDKGPGLTRQQHPGTGPDSGGVRGNYRQEDTAVTADKHAKYEARALATRENISYTAARRRLADQDPPQLVMTAATTCPPACDGSDHPRAVCRPWQPKDAKGARFEVRRAAELPTGRADGLARRNETPGSIMMVPKWLLALVYAMLTDQAPALLPDRAALRAAVEADDLDAVDTLMEPLDRAAARLLTKVPSQWWDDVKPRVDAYAAAVETSRAPSNWYEIEADHTLAQLIDQWHRAWTPVQNSGGYWDPPGVLWLAPKDWMDKLLTARHGGHAPGARVRLADGRQAVVYSAEWGEAGPPTAYRLRELVPGQYGNAGKLVPSLRSDELLPADQCLTEETDGG